MESILSMIMLFLGVCVPYSQKACMDAVIGQGLKPGGGGSNFIGDWSTKGCYAYKTGRYAGIAFYGTGGSDQEKKTLLNSDEIYRPIGHDCPSGNNKKRQMIKSLCVNLNYTYLDLWLVKH